MRVELLCGFAALTATAPVLASSGEGSPNPFAGDVGAAIWTLLTFGLVLIVLGKFAWGPILSALQGREEFIRNSLEEAKKDREDAQTSLAEYKKQMADARAEAKAIVDEGRRDGEVVQGKIEEDAKSEAEKMLERAKREIGIATDTAVQELYALSGSLATQIAARIIDKELNPAEHERLIAESITELSKVNGKS